jgi:isopenicillin N synthase-like dioxygenase
MTTSPSLPIIDLADLIAGAPGALDRVAAEVGAASRTIGFFYVRNHGVAPGRLAEVYAMAQAFFALPAADKMALTITRSLHNRGYAAVDSESLDPDAPPDLKEAFNIGREPEPGESWADDAPSHGVNQWPPLPGFQKLMSDYYDAMRRLGELLHRAFAVDLGLAPDHFARFVDRPMATLRLLRYPGGGAPGRHGAGAHTDYGNMTILSQDDVGGLEVRTRDGAWIAAPPIAGAFICNIGDCLMRWSNDIYASTPHRVVDLEGRERYSIAFFLDANEDALVECLPGCTGPDNPPRYPPITAGQHLRDKLDATYAFRQAAPSEG